MGTSNENERMKSQASFLNNLSVAMIATGVLAPIAGMVLTSNPDTIEKPLMVVVMLAYSFSGWFLHRKSSNIINQLVD